MDKTFKGFDPNSIPVRPAQPRSRAFGKFAVLAAMVVLLLSLGWYAIALYNGLQRSDELVDAEWSQVLNQYTRRADLIPSLVTVVRNYASHESKLFEDVAVARTKVMALAKSAADTRDPRMLDQFQEAQNRLSAPLSRLLAVAENYPDLKANELYRDLMFQLEGTENRISYSRQRYIGAIADYNLAIRTFPGNLIAGWAGYKVRPKFTVENESVIVQPPKIELK